MKQIRYFKRRFLVFKRKYFGTKKQFYSKTLLFFIGSIAFVFVHGLSQNTNRPFKEAELYEEIFVQGGDLSVVKKVFNKEEKSYRLDLFLDQSAQSVEESQREFEATYVTNRATDKNLKVKIIPVTSRYFVLMADDIEEDVEAIRFNVSYFSSPEASQEIIFYASKEHSSAIKESILSVTNEQLIVDSIRNDIRIQEKFIEESEKESKQIKEDISFRVSQYEDLNEEKKFQVGQQLEDSETRISSLRNTIQTLQEDLLTKSSEREEANERINLLKERIEEVQK